ncbi:alpha/beta hydrolase [Rhizobium sp. CECT 9324]|uniref:alpha/beta hydrolase n=1 Tax=Rhizobium sp. CECT 9324 TaxID=2845820 RepID=UPI001E2E0C65|nr:alpha/beta hydrolase [Rhizobium sp. CECT 9324]CAH0342688.1 hypothetical protein RHI9324_04417 [Rhizobium sp. CECT 9324]
MIEPDLYRIRDFVPDFDAIAAEFSGRSRALSARATIKADVAYGGRARETLDLIFPENPVAGAPLHVFVHGGYWRSGEKENYRFVAEPVLAVGGVAALVEYDLMPGERLPVLVNQVRRAVLWLQDHAGDFGVDKARITVSGHSAGAHLASYLCAMAPAETSQPRLPRLAGMLLVSGIYDLSGIPDSFLKHEAKMTPGEASGWSPLRSVHHDGPKRIIAYGADETRPFHEQAVALHATLSDAGKPVELLAVSSLNHMSVVLELGDSECLLGQRLAELTVAR